MFDAQDLAYFFLSSIIWFSNCYVLNLIFPTLLGKHFNEVITINVETYPSAADKSCILFVMYASNVVSHVLIYSLYRKVLCYLKFDWLTVDMQEDENKRTFKTILLRNLQVHCIFISLVWFLYCVSF